ncbi:MAG: CPBP family intramembrane metalloprotease [Planctomycetes bacterium]|nr:CPBP family intramembrane metalloprotease [Planctomycetota bacterium]
MTLKQYWRESRNFSLNVAFAFPALLVYELGCWVLGPRVRNGAQLLLRELFLEIGPLGVHLLNALLIAAAVVCVWEAWKRFDHLPARFSFLLLECLGYAALLGPLVLLLEAPLVRMATLVAGPGGTLGTALEKLVLALGAGVYEELFFRLLLMSAVFHVVFGLFKEARWAAAAVALLVSAVFFALCHHDLILVGGEPFVPRVFLFRTLAGVVLGLVFYLRGFAAAVYTHALYNLLLFLR